MIYHFPGSLTRESEMRGEEKMRREKKSEEEHIFLFNFTHFNRIHDVVMRKCGVEKKASKSTDRPQK